MSSIYRFPLAWAALMLVMVAAGSAPAHEGHDHGRESHQPPLAHAAPRLQAASGPFELVALPHGAELVIYLDVFETNAPITDAAIAVETPVGSLSAEPQGDTYRLAAPWAVPGAHSLIFTVTRGDQTEILSGTLAVPQPQAARPNASAFPALAQRWPALASGGIVLVAAVSFLAGLLVATWTRRGNKALAVSTAALLALHPGAGWGHEGHEHASDRPEVQPGGDRTQRLADGTLFVPKPTQRILGIRTDVAVSAMHRRVVELPGRIIPDPNASGFVQASVSGRLSPPLGGFPRLGTRVKAGDVLAFVAPPLQAIDVSDMRQKAGELDQQIDIVAKRVARYESLAKNGTVSRVTLDEALLELKGLRERRAAIERTRAEAERLVAPVGGIIAATNAVAGQIAESNAVVFQIIDPALLWVEALTFGPLAENQPATAVTSDGRRLQLSFRGAGLTDRSQAIPVHFAVEGEHKGLRAGQLVSVLAATGEQAEGFAVPRMSVVRVGNGQSVLFEHADAERFAPRTVRAEPLDSDRVLIRDGLSPGKRIVVQGAELLNQVR